MVDAEIEWHQASLITLYFLIGSINKKSMIRFLWDDTCPWGGLSTTKKEGCLLSSYFPIKESELKLQRGPVDLLMKSVSWKPSENALSGNSPSRNGQVDVHQLVNSLNDEKDSEGETLSIVNIAREQADGKSILPELINIVLLALSEGLAVSMHLVEKFKKASGLEKLQNSADTNSSKKLQEEVIDKKSTASAIAVFVTASYVVWRLERVNKEKISQTHVAFEGIPELPLDGPVTSLVCMLFYLCKHLDKRTQLVRTENEFVAMTIRYFEAIIAYIKERERGFKETEAFKQVKYKMEESDFTVEGFEPVSSSITAVATVAPVSFDDVVGNHDVIRFLRQQALKLLAWNPKTGKNIFMDKGGLITSTLLFGPPGSGKDLSVSAQLTEVLQGGKEIGVPTRYVPFPKSLVDKFQGETGRKTDEIFLMLRDPRWISVAVINDADSLLSARDSSNQSGGAQEFKSVYLVRMDGTESVWPGMSILHHMSNYPETHDPGMSSRMQVKYLVDGAKKFGDWLDQRFIEWRKLYADYGDLIDLTFNKDYKFGVEAKKARRVIQEIVDGGQRMPRDPKIAKAMTEVLGMGFKPNQQEFYAMWCEKVQEAYPVFTSRFEAVLFKIIRFKITDFDFPPDWDWRNNPDVFYRRSYEEQGAMIEEQVRLNLKGRSVYEIAFDETVKYLDTLAVIANTQEMKEVDARVKEMRYNHLARQKFEAGLAKGIA